MKHLVVSKALALILVFAMLFELMPANGFATPGDEAGSQSVQAWKQMEKMKTVQQSRKQRRKL